ncbi:MAG: carboxypeptidase-like regulatory domain-containing protein [Cyanobacteria bacterium SIG30]|nr:carboxypeptidase-like regulatory domain-containing protein [Cyanobacteria bacterium SIG30]
MKKIFLIILILALNIFFKTELFADTITGQINKNETLNTIIDKKTGKPLQGAKIVIPNLNFTTFTNEDGTFQLNAKIDKPIILSVQKEGYRPFSITIDKELIKNPLKIGVEKSRLGDITITNEIYHLGDNNFSEQSANVGDFKTKSIGQSLTKNFQIQALEKGEIVNIVIGSIIGLDTKLAKSFGQNNIEYAYSSPAEMYFNGHKIKEIHLNGDNIKIQVPNQLIRFNNQVTIKTGRNLFQTQYSDYDDIEVMNITVEIENYYNVAQE